MFVLFVHVGGWISVHKSVVTKKWVQKDPCLPGCYFQHGHFLVHFTRHARLGRSGMRFGYKLNAKVRPPHVAVLHELLNHLTRITAETHSCSSQIVLRFNRSIKYLNFGLSYA